MTRRIIMTALVVLVLGCDEPPNNTELCRDVYEALCYRADACGAYTYLDECISHYREECRTMRVHDQVNEPTEESAQACVAAIATLDCDGLDPSTLAECSFLVEPPDDGNDGGTEADAGSDADASTGEGDADDGADGGE